MPRGQRHRSAAARTDIISVSISSSIPSADIRVDASENARIQSFSNISIGKNTLLQSFPRFMELPFEIRSQIYRDSCERICMFDISDEFNVGCAIGDHMIHIDSRCRDETKDRDQIFFAKEYPNLVPVGFRCQSRISDAEKKERCSKRGDLDLRLLRVSWKSIVRSQDLSTASIRSFSSQGSTCGFQIYQRI